MIQFDTDRISEKDWSDQKKVLVRLNVNRLSSITLHALKLSNLT